MQLSRYNEDNYVLRPLITLLKQQNIKFVYVKHTVHASKILKMGKKLFVIREVVSYEDRSHRNNNKSGKIVRTFLSLFKVNDKSGDENGMEHITV